MIYSKQALLNRSFGVDLIRIPNVLIAALEVQIPESPADFTAYLDRTEADLQGFDFRDGKVTVSFPFVRSETHTVGTVRNIAERHRESSQDSKPYQGGDSAARRQ